MAKSIQLRWTKIPNEGNTPNGYFYESNLVQINGKGADIQIQLDNNPKTDVEISYLLSLQGDRFVSIFHDYFAELHIHPVPIKALGQIVKFRLNKLPSNGLIKGEDLVDAGNPSDDPNDPNNISNGFAGKDKEYFAGNDGEILVGKYSFKKRKPGLSSNYPQGMTKIDHYVIDSPSLGKQI